MTQNKLNKLTEDFFNGQNELLQKNNLPYGDLMPGGIVYVPTIVTTSTANNVVTAGMIKDIKYHVTDLPDIKLKRAIGYSYAIRLDGTNSNILLPVVTEMKLSLIDILGFNPETTLNMGTIEFSKFEDIPDMAGYSFELRCSVVSCVGLKNEK